VEPFVNDAGTVFTILPADRVSVHPPGTREWLLAFGARPAGSRLGAGTDAAKYWCPFPAVDGYPVTLEFTAAANAPATVQLDFGPR
jgi:hypothetical protein